MENEKEQQPAIEEFGEIIRTEVAARHGEQLTARDRRLESIDLAIRNAAEEIRDYLEARNRWELEDGVRYAAATLARGRERLEPRYIRLEMNEADKRQQEAAGAMYDLQDKAKPVLDRIARLYKMRKDLEDTLNSE